MTYVIVPEGGLRNRLQVLLSWLKKARSESRQLVVYWPIAVWCNGAFIPDVQILQRESVTLIMSAGRHVDH
jgi:hypothetical protein